MKLQLSLKEKKVALVLENDARIIEEQIWVDENDLLEKFFPILDAMLLNNDVNIKDIDEFLLDTNIPRGYTTARIARTIIKTLNFAHKL